MMRNIDTHNINYPKSFAKLTDDQNTNTILNAIANRAIHLNKNPIGREFKDVWIILYWYQMEKKKRGRKPKMVDQPKLLDMTNPFAK